MCGRYRLTRPDRLAAMRALPSLEEFSETRIVPRFNIAPSQDIAVIRMNAADHPTVGLIRWGLIPSWMRGKPKAQPINARAETVASSGMFKGAFERRRCLIPADGFYEWRRMEGQPNQPMMIHRRDDDLFCFAGLWERWTPGEGIEPVDTCAILTTTPNELMADIHDRMPVILDESDYATWLNRDVKGADVADLLRPYDADQMEAVKVSTVVNSPSNDVRECIEPLV